MKEPYVKPEVKSEVLEPEALTGGGSGVGGGGENACPNNPADITCPDGCQDKFC